MEEAPLSHRYNPACHVTELMLLMLASCCRNVQEDVEAEAEGTDEGV